MARSRVISKSRIPEAQAAIAREMDGLVFRIANSIRNEAVKLVQSGSRSGRTYKRGGVTHQASAPGEPPKTDTGALMRSIRVEHTPGSGTARVVVGAKYAAELEFGTKKMAPRPFLRPAIAKVQSMVAELLKSVSIKVEK